MSNMMLLLSECVHLPCVVSNRLSVKNQLTQCLSADESHPSCIFENIMNISFHTKAPNSEVNILFWSEQVPLIG